MIKLVRSDQHKQYLNCFKPSLMPHPSLTSVLDGKQNSFNWLHQNTWVQEKITGYTNLLTQTYLDIF